MDSGGSKEAQIQSYMPRGATRNLANTIKPSIYGGDAALCQITLTTFVSDIAIFELQRDVKLQLTNFDHLYLNFVFSSQIILLIISVLNCIGLRIVLKF